MHVALRSFDGARAHDAPTTVVWCLLYRPSYQQYGHRSDNITVSDVAVNIAVTVSITHGGVDPCARGWLQDGVGGGQVVRLPALRPQGGHAGVLRHKAKQPIK